MIRLFIDDLECDLAANNELAITRQVATALNLENRQTDFSSRFLLPFTPNNDTIMEMLRFNGSQSDRPYKTTSARVQDGNLLIADNLIIITDKIVNNGYDVRLLGSTFDYVKQMKEKKLSDTTFLEDYTHTLDPATWISLQGNADGLTYTASGGALGGVGVGRLFADMSYPAIYTKSIFEAILNEYFAKFSGDIFFKDCFVNELTACANFTSDKMIALEKTTAEITSFTGISLGLNGIEFQAFTKNDKNFLSNAPFASPTFTLYIPINDRNVNVNANIRITLNSSSEIGKLQIRKGVGTSYFVNPSDEILAESEDIQGAITILLNLTYEGDILKGEYLYMTFDLSSGSTATIEDGDITIDVNDVSIFGDTFNPTIYLPDITQYDYFQDAVKRFGLIYSIDISGNIRFETFKDVFDSAFGTDEWTDKNAGSRDTDFDYGKYGKLSYFEFQGDRSATNVVGYNGWKQVIFDNDNYDAEKVILKSIGAAIGVINGSGSVSQLGVDFNNQLIVFNPPLYLKSYTAPVYVIADKTPAPFNLEIYLMHDGFNSGNTGIDLLLGQTINICDGQDFEVLTVQCFGNLLKSIERPQVFTMDMNLSVVDFYNLDFFKLKYFEQFQSYFYLIKAENFIPGKLTKCTFLKVQRA